MGHGLFATESIKLGEFVIEYTGRKITAEFADKLQTRYLFEINKYWTIDGSVRTNIARYVNHCCDPNCEADIKKGRILFTAIRDIEKGEEFTIDYGEEYFDEFIKPYGCKCPSCALGREIAAAV